MAGSWFSLGTEMPSQIGLPGSWRCPIAARCINLNVGVMVVVVTVVVVVVVVVVVFDVIVVVIAMVVRAPRTCKGSGSFPEDRGIPRDPGHSRGRGDSSGHHFWSLYHL
jgi:hypothetical protein